jgi:hypothetical protein
VLHDPSFIPAYRGQVTTGVAEAASTAIRTAEAPSGPGHDALIAALASRQHGVISRDQLRRLGLSDAAIDRRVAAGRLHRLARGVFAVGHTVLTAMGRLMAGVLAAGPGAVVSGRSAAGLWAIRPNASPIVEITGPRRVRLRGLRAHQGVLRPDECTLNERIPVTTAARTLLDLAAVLGRHELERCIERAEALRLADAVPLSVLLARCPRRRGTRQLREILDHGVAGDRITRSELEERFLEFLVSYGLPRPDLNATVTIRGRQLELDCLWRPERLAVELDGYATHGTRAAFERDRERDRLLQRARIRPIRVTWLALRDEPDRLRADLAELLGQ